VQPRSFAGVQYSGMVATPEKVIAVVDDIGRPDMK